MNAVPPKVLYVCVLTCVSLGACAQTSMGNYHMGYFNKDYLVHQPAEGGFYIYCSSLSDAKISECGIMVPIGKVVEFREAFAQARNKFTEWSMTAKANNVTSLDKEMPMSVKDLEGFWKTVDVHIDLSVSLRFRFKILSDGTHVMIASTGKLIAADNQFIDIDDMGIVFTRAAEFDAFLSLTDPARVLDKMKADTAKDTLFK